MGKSGRFLEEIKTMSGGNQGREILVTDWLITSHVTSISSSDWLVTWSGRLLGELLETRAGETGSEFVSYLVFAKLAF